jgi:Peptidase family C25
MMKYLKYLIAGLGLIFIFGSLNSEPIWKFSQSNKISIASTDLSDDESFLSQAKLIAVPEGFKPEVKVTLLDSDIYPAGAYPNLKTKLAEDNDNSVVRIGSPAKMRDLSVVPLIVKLLRYDKNCDQVVYYKNIELTIKGLPICRPRKVSSAFDVIYRNTILNYESSGITTPQGYLIIVPDEYYNNILPFARWKEQQGWYVTITKLSQIGGNVPQLIKNYIADAYATWQIPPEYVLLVGSEPKLLPFSSRFINTVTDYPYFCVAGNDNLADVLVGRFPADNTSELDVMVAKTIGYEKTPYLGDTLWYRKALMVATTYQEGGGRVVTALETKRWVREQLLNFGFLKVDTVFHDPPYQNPNAPETIRVLVNAGYNIINGRGWGNSNGWQYPTFLQGDVSGLSNGWKLPVITSIYCGTANFHANPCFGEVWLRTGTPTSPRGGVAFFGASWVATSTRFNNCIDYGIYQGIVREGITSFGAATYRGKIELVKNFPLACDSFYLRAHMETYNLLGDPSLNLWTAVPKPLSVEYPTTIPIGGNYFTVRVTDYTNEPMANALVSLWKTNEVKATGYTDADGFISLAIEPTTSDTMFLTVTANNRVPFCRNVMVNSAGLYVGYFDHTISNLAPGLIASLNVTLKNYGTSQTAFNTSVRLRTQDRLVYITDSIKSYGDIGPGATASSSPFQFFVSESCPNNHEISFVLVIQSGDSTWHSGVDIVVPAPNLVAVHPAIIDGGNGLLDPSETADLTVWLKNLGGLTIQNGQGVLRTLTNAAIIFDSVGQFGSINPGDSAINNGDHFQVFAQSSCAIGRGIPLQLSITGNGAQQVINFAIYIGQVTTAAPLGPDLHGYFAYDNTDIVYPEHPEYSWFEIDPNFGGSGSRIQLGNDDIKLVSLPFTFRYYGRDYNRISVCSNGYLAMDSAWITDPYNWHIPSAMGPSALIAPFWDDLRPDTLNASGVYYYNDASNHRFITEWSRVHHVHGFYQPIIAELQTFQAILFDPAYYLTRNGDGEILFQYDTVVNDDSSSLSPPVAHNYATTGIENYEHSTGIEYTYANLYPPAAVPLANGLAIKFTTDPPDSFAGVSETPTRTNPSIIDTKLECQPNPFYNKIEFKNIDFGIQNLQIFNAMGRLVLSLQSPVTSHRFVWDGKDRLGRPVAPGLYFACFKSVQGGLKQSENQIVKIIKLK